MAKQLNVNLGFTADTSQAKAKIQELQNSLTALINTPTGNFGNKMTKDIQQGIKAAAELKTHLKNATNVETGSLDFSKLNQSIKQSGSSLDSYGQKLQALGADGQKAFMQFAQSVATSEIPIRRSNAMLTEMWTTLKNTARWQISSSILHGFMGALQSAYGYAQDLNESLNNIRIVTGKNIDEMATFAAQANKAAKALSATTTEYTDASLIYYQQGLDGAAVEERAAVTLKMANVSRQSAEVVSDQMTAVWNNFYDGSKSLEYYADVMTALGAATASSTDEISQGLEKFAAVADTVGLSYEYATAALATVTSETRQSADVVGTAFKTLFARIEGLSLGETLDDGTNLTKYSEALLKVGINVKDQNGQLKDMDSILNEMGSKWSTLAKDQQVALAQTVGGVRQYNQLISLMDNWDKFQQNLGTAQGSTGALQEQADIYAESWEAAQDRVRAAAEAIYSDLLNDEAFIDILNIVEDFLTLIDNIIDSVGGLQGVLTNVGAILLKIFSSQMSQGITNMAYSFQMMTKAGREKVQNEKTDFIDNAVNSIQVDNTATPNANTRRQEMLKAELEVQKEMIEASGRMSELEQQTNQILLDRQRVLSENAIKTAETEDAAKERVSNAHMAGRIELAENQLTGGRYVNPDFVREDNAQYTQLTNTLSKTIALDIDLTELLQLREQTGLTEQDFSELATKISKLENVQLDGIIADIKSVGVESEHGKEYVDQLLATIRMVINNTQSDLDSQLGISPEVIEELSAAYREEIRSVKESKKANEEAKKAREESSKSIKNAKGAQKQWSDTLVQSAQSTLSLVSALQSIINLGNIWSNENLTGGEKLLQTIMALGTAIPMAVSGLKGFSSAISSSALMQQVLTIQTQRQTMALNEQSAAEIRTAAVKLASSKTDKEALSLNALKIAAEKLGIEVTEESTHKTLKKAIAQKLGITLTDRTTTASLLEAAAHSLTAKATGKETTSKIAATGATIAETLAQHGLNAALAPFIGLMLAAVAAIAPYLIALGAIIAVIALVVVGIKALNKAYNQDAIAAEKAAQQVELLTEKYNKAKEAADAFKQSISNYESARDELSKLTKGTEEYNAAVEKSNTLAKELIEKYDLWNSFSYDGKLINIDQNVLKEKYNEDLNTVAQADSDKYAAEIYKDKAVQKSANTDLIRDIGRVKYFSGSRDDIYSQEQWMFAKKMEQDDLDEIYKKMIESGIDFNNVSDEFFENWLKAPVDEFGNSMSAFSLDVSQSASELAKYRQELIKNSVEVENNTKKHKEQAMQLIKNEITDTEEERNQLFNLAGGDEEVYNQVVNAKAYALANSTVNGKTLAETIASVKDAGDSNAALEANYKSYLKETYGKDYGNMSDEKTARLYAVEFLNYSLEEAEQLIYEKGKGVGSLKTASGEEILSEMNDRDMRDALGKLFGEREATKKFMEQGGTTSEQYDTAISNLLSSGSLGKSVLASLQNGIENATFEEVYGQISSVAEQQELRNLDENELLKRLKINEEEVKALGYKTAEDFEKAFDEGLQGWSIEAFQEAQQEKADSMLSEAATKYELDENVLKLQTELIKENTKGMEDNAVAAAQMAIANQRLNKGVDTLTEDWEEWNKVLRNGDKTSQEYAEALSGVEGALKNILNLSDNSIVPAEFLQSEETLDLLNEIADGSEEAVEKLGFNLAKAQVEAQELITDIQKNIAEMFTSKEDDFISTEEISQKFEEIRNNAVDAINGIQEAFEGLSPGQTLSGTKAQEFADALNEYAMMTGMSVEQMQSMLNSMQVTADVTTTTKTIKSKVPNVEKTRGFTQMAHDEETGELIGFKWTESSRVIDYTPVDEVIQVAQINTDTPPTFTNIDAGTISSSVTTTGKSSGSNSSSSAGNTSKKTKKSDVVERYKEITDQLDDVTRATDKASKAADRLYGPARLKAMKDVSKSLKEELNLLEKKSKEVAQNYADDQFHLNSVSKSAGLNFEYDESGNITNYTSEMNKLYNQVAAAEASGDEDAIELAQLKVDTITDAIEQYDETRELWEDVADEMDEKFYEWQDNNAAIFEYELEIKLDTNEFENKFLEFEKDLFADDAYSFAESVAATGGLLRNSQEDLQSYSQSFNELQKLFAEGKISQASFMEQLQNLSDGALEKFGDIVEYDKEMLEAYRKQLELNSEELAEYTDQFEHLNSVLDHYQTLMELTGDGQDLQALQKILDAQAQVAADRYAISLEYYQDKKAEMEELERQLSEATAAGLDTELLKEELKAAREAFQEAEEGYLSDAEANAEAIKNAYVNNLAIIKDEFQKALTGGTDFDYLNTQMERLQSTQEEYLTTTNKIYETNKLINQAEREIDQTSNTVAKSKLKAFQQETSQLQNQGRLSQFELDIQQKKYDLLLAEIALEEAQNAKSTVRLTRDSEGNFGYVYTADQEQVADAQQNVDDAANALYNTQLEGANKYAQQRVELLQAMYEEIEAINENEALSAEEKDSRIAETMEYYYAQMESNSELYNIAIQDDIRITQDSWSSNLDIMGQDVGYFFNATKTYLTQAEEISSDYRDKMDEIANDVGIASQYMDGSLNAVRQASSELKDEIVNSLLPAQQKNLENIRLLTAAYAANRTNTDTLKTAYYKLAGAMSAAYSNASSLETQLKHTNQAAKLIGGTGWVTWDYTIDDEGNHDSGSSGDRDNGGDKDKDNKNKNTSSSAPRAFYTVVDAKTNSWGGKVIKLDNGYWFTENSLINQGGGHYSIKNDVYGGTSIDPLTHNLKNVKKFDTGGYTGEWGASGKLAMLHEKEIILNKEDTKNFLASLELLHNIIKMIDINTSNSLINRLDSADLKTNKSNDILEQHVTIEAVFPNVEDRYEIEEAFMNLTNEASQYINRKNN